jgi:hypothetical protein
VLSFPVDVSAPDLDIPRGARFLLQNRSPSLFGYVINHEICKFISPAIVPPLATQGTDRLKIVDELERVGSREQDIVLTAIQTVVACSPDLMDKKSTKVADVVTSWDRGLKPGRRSFTGVSQSIFPSSTKDATVAATSAFEETPVERLSLHQRPICPPDSGVQNSRRARSCLGAELQKIIQLCLKGRLSPQ